MLVALAFVISAAVIGKFTYDVIYMVYACFFRPAKDLKAYGEWAVVTGATDGIGKAMAKNMSKKGMKVLLISRNQERLDATKAEMASQAETLVIDYANFDEAARQKVKQAIEGKDVGVLVNNVGVSYDHACLFNDLDDAEISSLHALNIDSTVWMTKLVLPGMLAKRKGAVVNMSSAAGISMNCAFYALYCGAKAFIYAFTNSLHSEYKGKGIDFQCQYPSLVTSKLSKVRKASMSIPSADQFAASAVRCIGYDRHLSPFWYHWIEVAVFSAVPEWVQDKIMWALHLPLNKKWLKKQQDKKE